MVTSSGWSTNPLTTYSRKASMAGNSSSCRSGSGELVSFPAGFFNETGDRIAWLGPFAEPILSAFEIQSKVVALFERLIRAEFLDEFAIARAAAISNHNAENRGVFGPYPLHANFNCHKSVICLSDASTQLVCRP